MHPVLRSLSLLSVACSAVAAAAPDRPAAVLDLPGGGFLVGRLAERTADAGPLATLAWQSPLFVEPVEFRIDAIGRVRFPRGGPAPPAAGWRVDLDGGDFLLGELGGLDAAHLTFLPADLGVQEVRIRRAAVARLTRLDAGTIVAVPGGIEAWRTAAAWTGDAGRPATRERGAVAHLPIDAPRRACYEVAISWEQRPEFEIAVAADPRAMPSPSGGAPTRAGDSFRIESVGGTLLAVREGDKAVADVIGELAEADRGLRVRIFVDRDRGRMAVVLPAGAAAARAVFDATLPPKAAAEGGVLVRLRSGDLRIDDLRVTEWRDEEPRSVVDAAPLAESYAAATGEFTLRDGDVRRRLPADKAATLVVRAQGGPPAAVAPETVRAVFRGGSQISGRLRAVAAEALVVAAPALAAELACPFDRLAVLEAGVPRDPPRGPGREGVLDAVHGRAAGCLATPAVGAGLAWLPRGAVAAARVRPDVEPLRIVYAAAPGGAGDEPGAPGPAVAYLRNGDALSCAVLAGDAEGLRLRTAVAADVPVPAAALRAVELVPAEPLGVPREKLARLLTLPRMQQADPPTHMLRLQSGDYVRGRLRALDDARVRFEVLGAVKDFPRDQVTRLIWLTREDDPPAAAPALPPGDGLPVQGVMRDGRRLTIGVDRLVGDRLVGRHAVLGEAGIDLPACDRLLVAGAIAETPPDALPYAKWVLKPAAVPGTHKAVEKRSSARAEQPPSPPAPAAATAEELAALAAAERAAFAGDRSCLEPLGELLAAGSRDVRRRALVLLRQMTGRPSRELAFRPDDPPEQSQADVFRWRQWIAREGTLAELVFPRPPDAAALARVRGRTLCSVPGENAVIEIDDRGRETFRAQARSAYACDLLPDGSRLFGDGRSVVEYDPAGREVWSLPDLPREPMSVRRLDNGNTLVAFDGFDDRAGVMEYDRTGALVWKWNSRGQPADAVRLPDGNTLVALHGENLVVEIDDAGSEAWRVVVDDPLRVERLADGTTLVVSGDSRRGWVYDHDGGVVRELGELADAGPAADGLTVLDHDGELSLRPAVGPEKPVGRLPAGTARFRSR